jgi:adenylyltransferase/sulfurtransferase
MTPDERERFLRHILLKEVGAQGQKKLLSSSVLVVGAGGLGAPVIQYLAAAGIGRIGICDHDVVSLSNLQRQVIYRTDDIGRLKVEAAADAARAINPALAVDEFPTAFDNAFDPATFAAYDVVIDCLDSFKARFVLSDASIAARVPLVYAALGRFDAQLSLFAPWRGEHPCYRCLVPSAPDIEENCEAQGVIGPVPGVIGALAALEALKELVGMGDSLVGKLVLFDGLAPSMRTVDFPRDPACASCAMLKRDAD